MAAVLLRAADELRLIEGGAERRFPLGRSGREAADAWQAPGDRLAEAVGAWLRDARVAGPVAVAGTRLRELVDLAGVPARSATAEELRDAARTRGPVRSERARGFCLDAARGELERRLASDDEALVTLVREETRVERALQREARALEQFVAPRAGPLADARDRSRGLVEELRRRNAATDAQVAEVARRVLPNLSELVGPLIAARLAAAAGGTSALGRISASRLQLLGSRRRPAGGHGPRYGLMVRAARVSELPLEVQARYVRSLAAMAVIAARADVLTRRSLGDGLLRRRDRRLRELQGRR